MITYHYLIHHCFHYTKPSIPIIPSMQDSHAIAHKDLTWVHNAPTLRYTSLPCAGCISWIQIRHSIHLLALRTPLPINVTGEPSRSVYSKAFDLACLSSPCTEQSFGYPFDGDVSRSIPPAGLAKPPEHPFPLSQNSVASLPNYRTHRTRIDAHPPRYVHVQCTL